MRINFDKLTKGILIFSALLIAFSFFYYYVVFLPQKEEIKLEQQKEKYKACLQKCDAKHPWRFPGESNLPLICKSECGEKYAKPLPDLPKLPEINLPE